MKKDPLINIGSLKLLLKENGLVLKKNRGQNFLIDGNILRKIIREADPGPADRILEIGAGPGTLTRELCRRAGSVVAVEWDRGLAKILKKQTADFGNLRLVQGDILSLDLGELLAIGFSGAGGEESGGEIKVVSNLPYSIASPVLIKLLESRSGIRRMICMVQEDLGRRLVSGPGKKTYGILSLIARMHSRPRLAFTVSGNCFFPRPAVSSAVINFHMRRSPAHPVKDIRLWKALVKAGFGGRRKMLKNALAQDARLGYTASEIAEAGRAAKIDLRLRAEQLSTADFARLANALGERGKR